MIETNINKMIKNTNLKLSLREKKILREHDGINIKKLNEYNENIQQTNGELRLSKYNHIFNDYKDIHVDKTAVIFATGNSLNKLTQLSDKCKTDYVKMGVNKIYNNYDISSSLDYYFANMRIGMSDEHLHNMYDYNTRHPNITKFLTTYTNGFIENDTELAKEELIDEIINKVKIMNGVPYDLQYYKFPKDITKESLLGNSIVFPALQFALHTGVNRIYLVGCDASVMHFYNDGEEQDEIDMHYLYWWIKFHQYALEKYPNVEIISVNPVCIKGLFNDVYVDII